MSEPLGRNDRRRLVEEMWGALPWSVIMADLGHTRLDSMYNALRRWGMRDALAHFKDYRERLAASAPPQERDELGHFIAERIAA